MARLKPFSEPKWSSIKALISEWEMGSKKQKRDLRKLAEQVADLRAEIVMAIDDYFMMDKYYTILERMESDIYGLCKTEEGLHK